MITVSISYKLSSGEGWQVIDLPAASYFDMECVEDSEPLEVDSVPIYNDVLDYLHDLIEKPGQAQYSLLRPKT